MAVFHTPCASFTSHLEVGHVVVSVCSFVLQFQSEVRYTNSIYEKEKIIANIARNIHLSFGHLVHVHNFPDLCSFTNIISINY